jgi:hypothetical protein
MVERNGSGYVSPTENAGIYRVSRGIKDSLQKIGDRYRKDLSK